jgi:hypothetical protein
MTILSCLLNHSIFSKGSDIYTIDAIQNDLKNMQRWLGQFQAFETAGWLIDNKIDCTLIIQLLKSFIRSIEIHQMYRRNPGFAIDECLGGVHMLLIRNFAPLQKRMSCVLGRLREVSRLINECREHINPAEVPLVWARLAIENANHGATFLSDAVPEIARQTPELFNEIKKTGKSAGDALLEYAAWIEQAIIPNAQGKFSIGKIAFDELLRENHMVNYDADQLLAEGWRLVDETETEMEVLASSIDPTRNARELLDICKNDHPAMDELIKVYQDAMCKARQFAINNQIVSIPGDELIRIDPTPEFLRNLIPFAAYDPPGFFEPVQEGVFYVTLPVRGDNPDKIEKNLRSHPLVDIPVTALHEAYPGHHLQFVVANRIGSKIRKFGCMLSPLFVEGWAFYCEVLMEQMGFIDKPIQKLARLQAQLWRAVRIVLDVSLHTRGMSIDDAVALLVQRAGLEPDDALAEVHRYTLSPTQPQSYLMGKIEIMKMVEKYRTCYPNADMKKMHDDILACGPLPPGLMWLKLSSIKHSN